MDQVGTEDRVWGKQCSLELIWMDGLSTSNFRQPWHTGMGAVLQIPFKTIQIQGFGLTNAGDIAASCKS